jgi:molybdate transport system substrate-binding protein
MKPGRTARRAGAVAAALVALLGLASFWARQVTGGQAQQLTAGRIHGTVKDQTGGAIVGASVTIINGAGGIARNLPTDGSGMYSASDLPPGMYTVRAAGSATSPGWQTSERANLLLEAGGDLAIDVVLRPGSCPPGSCITITEETPLPNRRALRILCSTAVHTPMEAMKAQLEGAAGRPVTIEWDSSQRLGAKIDAGEAFDIAVLSTEGMDTYVQKGAVTAASRTYLGRTGAAMAVRAGAPKPDISTREKLKQVLLNAKSIAMNPTGASGVHFNRIIQEMGIAEQIKPKMVLSAEPGSQPKNVAEGRAEMIWTQSTEIGPYPGIEMIGPLPPDVQSYSTFEMGVAARSSNAAAAGAVVKFLTSDAAKAAFRSAFVEVR